MESFAVRRAPGKPLDSHLGREALNFHDVVTSHLWEGFWVFFALCRLGVRIDFLPRHLPPTKRNVTLILVHVERT